LTAGNLTRLPQYVVSGLKYHLAGRIYTPKPLYATLRVTRRCNSRCVMCSDWRRQWDGAELTASQTREILSNPLFESVQKFALSGGEPTLRDDLVELADTALSCLPKMRSLALLTNGLDPDAVAAKTEGLLKLPGTANLETLSVSVSIDGYGDDHERIRRVPGAFEKVTETLRRLAELQGEHPFYLCATCVVQPWNVKGLVRLSEFCEQTAIPLSFAPVCASEFFVEDPASRDSLAFSESDLAEFRSVFERYLEARLTPSNVPFWREYFDIVAGKGRKTPCFLSRHYAGLNSDGTLYMCPAGASPVYGSALDVPPDQLWYSDQADRMRDRVEKEYCPSCTISCDSAFCFRQEFFFYATFLLKERMGKYLRRKRHGRF
jgi:MoaA/NifB/PqqE/SkfB family radical SAM enzyme